MIDTKDLREKITTKGLDVVADTDILAVLDRLEAAEENLSCCRAEREEAASLFLSVKTRLTEERDALRAKIEQMEKQEPVAFVLNAPKLKRCAALLDAGKKLPHKTKLYALPGVQPKPGCGEAGHDEGRCGNRQCLPGAQPAPSIPEFCPCCGNIMRACMCCPNEDCNAVTVTAEQAKYNKQHAVARKASGAAEPTPEAKP